MFEECKIEIKKLLISKKLWKEEYTILPNSKNGGQSLCFFIRDSENKPVYVAKFFDFLKDLVEVTQIVDVDGCASIEEYIELLENNQIPYEIEKINEAIYYRKRSFKRYIEVTNDCDVFPKVYAFKDIIKIKKSFYGLLIEEAIIGVTLQEKMNNIVMDGTYNINFAVKNLIDIGYALEKLCSKGYVHRDLSPDNIMIDEKERTIIIDPGTIKIINRDTTDVGFIMGKKIYVSPEQYFGYAKNADFSSDLYSLGIITFQIVTGTNLLKVYAEKNQNNFHQIICKELDRSIEDLFYNFCDEKLEKNIILYRIIKKMIQFDKSLRFSSIQSFMDAIKILEEGEYD